jgi:acetylornithine deacetylase/succinyl-diaminopimelate desuccinylase-like protein
LGSGRVPPTTRPEEANLFATIQKGARPGIVLSGHTDVVPVDGQPWDTDPFAAIIKDDRIYPAAPAHEVISSPPRRDDAAFLAAD